MKSTFHFFILFIITMLPLAARTQSLREGAVNVLISEKFASQQLHTTSRVNGRAEVSFTHPAMEQIFLQNRITKFERTYPGIEKYKHPHTKILSRYYTIEGNFKRDRVIYDILHDGSGLFEDVEPLGEASASFTPNDYSLLTFGDVHLNQVRAPLAWNITKGNRSVVVGVSDPQGFYFSHPDYINSDGSNQIVYIDPSADNQNSAGAHGLIVSSTVAAATNNNEGISALGYNTALMAFGGTPYDMFYASYEKNAPIVVASYTTSCFYFNDHQLLMDMMHDNGTTVIVAAGNGNISASSCPSADGQKNGYTYPASYDHVISVGGVNNNDKYTQAVGSPELGHLTFNDKVDLTAPGWNIKFATSGSGGHTYGGGTGTSMAAPMVAGLAALMLSIEPDLSPDQVEFFLKSTAVNVDNLAGNEVYAGLAGAGRIDAFAGVSRVFQCYACENVYNLPEQIDENPPSVPSYVEGCKIAIADYEMQPLETYQVVGTREVRLLPGFSALQGSNASFKIYAPCILPTQPSELRKRNTGMEHITYQSLIRSGQIEIPQEDVSEEEKNGVSSYPNPAKESVTVKYSLKTDSHVSLQLQDLSGKVLDTLIDEFQEKGEHEVNYNVSALTGGVYFYVLKTNSQSKLGRLVVVR